MRRPNLFVIGAMKSGTTSLHSYLAEHPDVFMCNDKEPHYFVEELNWKKGQDWYLSLFADANQQAIVGESSTYYTKLPTYPGVVERIAEFSPDAKFVYMMRDPVERCISQYWHHYQGRRSYDTENRPLALALRENERYIAYSDYAMQLRPYIEAFGRDRMFLMTLEEFQSNPRKWIHDLFAWLGVDSEFVPERLGRKIHATSSVVYRRVRWFHQLRNSRVWDVVRMGVPAPVRKFGSRIAQRDPIDRTSVSTDEAVEYLRPILQDKSRELSELLGRDFPEWTTLWATEKLRVDSEKNEPGKDASSASI